MSEYIFEFLTVPLFVLPLFFIFSSSQKLFYVFLWISFFLGALTFAISENGILSVGVLTVLSLVSLFSENIFALLLKKQRNKIRYSIVVGKNIDRSEILLFDGENLFESFVLEPNEYNIGKIVKNTGGIFCEVSGSFLQHRRRS